MKQLTPAKKIKNRSRFAIFVFLCALNPLFAKATQDESIPLPVVVVSGESDVLRLKKGDVSRVETLKARDLQKKNALTFAQAIDNERGIDTQTACAFCGAKRISINGFKGEHTTILIDGLPLHSTVSGFYGVEAIPMGGIDSIEIYRGSGSALSAPESIGGAINIVTKEIVTTSAEGQASFSHDGQKNISVLGTKKITDRTGVLLGLQYGEIRSVDLDGNGISEQPSQKTQGLVSKISHRINDNDDISLRFSYGKTRNIGGSMHDLELDAPPSVLATSSDFQDNDVRKKYIGDERKITENVTLDRYELAAIYKAAVDKNSSLTVSLGSALQAQKSIYSHGYDYDNRDSLWVGVLEYQHALGTEHLLTMGMDTKSQMMDSSSKSLYELRSPPLRQDDLTFKSLGGFIQDTWIASDTNELSLVLRFDHIKTQWSDLNKSLEKSVLAPRLMFKHLHNQMLTSRLAAGLGYRSPLTLFESQHGTTHDGFTIDVTELETAQSFLYSLSGQWQDDFFEFSSHLTRLENMAYGLDRADTDEATLFKNSADAYTISVFDLSYGRRITHHWTIESLFEVFNYPKGYKEKLPVAAIEKRFSLTSNVEWGKWKASQKLIAVGERDLSAYGYNKHYNIAVTDQDTLSPTFGQTLASAQKRQTAPTYFTLDLNFERAINQNFSVNFSVLNVFDETQTKSGDSPTTWDLHGDHFHLDNFHIWGPLRCRQFFVGIKGSI